MRGDDDYYTPPGEMFPADERGAEAGSVRHTAGPWATAGAIKIRHIGNCCKPTRVRDVWPRLWESDGEGAVGVAGRRASHTLSPSPLRKRLLRAGRRG
jgi:hypothetical protein